MTSINFDNSGTPILPHMNPQYSTSITPNPLNQLQSVIQFQVLKYFQTGDPIYDIFLSYILITLLASGITKMSYLLSQIFDCIRYYTTLCLSTIYIYSRNRIIRLFNRITQNRYKDLELMHKTVYIEYITENKTINELYKAVNWYLSNAEEIDYIHETPLNFACEKKQNHLFYYSKSPINKYPINNREKKLIYKKHEIRYILSKSIISIYTDSEKKKENFKITLMTKIDPKSTDDVLEDFCQYCLQEYEKSLTSSTWIQNIYFNEGAKWISKPSNNYRKFETIILKNNLLDDIKSDIQLFLNSADWYQHRDIPYTRGYLFYGNPGTGKTSCIKALSNYTKRHIHFLMLNNVSNDAELLELFSNIAYEDTIVVIEDIDCMTEIIRNRNLIKDDKDESGDESYSESSESEDERKRRRRRYKKNKNKINNKINNDIDQPVYKRRDYNIEKPKHDTRKLTLSGLLNAIDGVFNTKGRILIMTTNHPEVLDDALIRPGRIDRKFLFDYCNKQQVKELFEMFFGKTCDESQLKYVKDELYSPAHITSLFMRYRNTPEVALLHIDDEYERPVIEPLIKPTINPTPPSEDVKNTLSQQNRSSIEQTINGSPSTTFQFDDISGVSAKDIMDVITNKSNN